MVKAKLEKDLEGKSEEEKKRLRFYDAPKDGHIYLNESEIEKSIRVTGREHPSYQKQKKDYQRRVLAGLYEPIRITIDYSCNFL